MKIDRLMGILTVLLRQDKATAAQLAERFEVSVRTISRDIETLCRAGIPLVTVQGYGGGVSIAEGYTIDKTLLSEEDLQSILTGLRGLDSVSAVPRSAQLAEKLGTAPGEDVMRIDLASHYQASLSRKIGLIWQAVRERRLLSFDYYSEKGRGRRVIEPYHLAFQWSSWYVWGWCTRRQDFRLFKLNRAWNLALNQETFPARELPEFRPERFLEREAFRLKALFAPEALYRLVEEYGPDCCAPAEDGRLLFQRGFAGYGAMLEYVLRFGDQVEVLEPAELRADLRRQAERLLKKYREP